MSDRLSDDPMEDLLEPEGPARHPFDDPHGFEDPLEDPLEDPHGFDPHGMEDLHAAPELAEEMEDAVTDALDADSADEFFGNLFKKVLPMVAKVAPLLPIPGAGLIGKAAEVIGNWLRTRPRKWMHSTA